LESFSDCYKVNVQHDMSIIELNKREIAVIGGGIVYIGKFIGAAIFGCIYAPQPTIASKIKTTVITIGCIEVLPILVGMSCVYIGGVGSVTVAMVAVDSEYRENLKKLAVYIAESTFFFIANWLF